MSAPLGASATMNASLRARMACISSDTAGSAVGEAFAVVLIAEGVAEASTTVDDGTIGNDVSKLPVDGDSSKAV